MTNWQDVEHKYYMGTFKRVPVVIVRGSGALVWDDAGKEYLDFVGGWACDSLGHCHPVVSEALSRQAHTLIQTSNQFYTVPQLELAELLVKNSQLTRVFFANSGVEAAEGAVKLARRYGKLKLNGAFETITAMNSFHGRTLAMTAATGQSKFQEPYLPMPVGFKNVPYNNVDALRQAISKDTAAIMIEPLQGEGGVNIPDDDYLKKVRALCDEKGILLILDEVQTGIGRLGTLFGYEQAGVVPDIMVLAKGLGSGVPIGAIMCTEKANVFVPGDHGGTFGGNPLVCAAGYATLKFILEHNVCDNVKKMGEYFTKGLLGLKKKYPVVSDVRGKGLLIAIEFKKDLGDAALATCLEEGMLVNKVKPNALRFMPPLTIGKSEVDRAVAILDRVIGRISNQA